MNGHIDGGTGTNGGQFTQWHLDLQNELITRGYPVTTIPCGAIFCELILNAAYFSGLEFTDWFEDDAPHGRASTYFMFGLICYIALYKQDPTVGYVPPVLSPVILPEITNNLSSIYADINTLLTTYELYGFVRP